VAQPSHIAPKRGASDRTGQVAQGLGLREHGLPALAQFRLLRRGVGGVLQRGEVGTEVSRGLERLDRAEGFAFVLQAAARAVGLGVGFVEVLEARLPELVEQGAQLVERRHGLGDVGDVLRLPNCQLFFALFVKVGACR